MSSNDTKEKAAALAGPQKPQQTAAETLSGYNFERTRVFTVDYKSPLDGQTYQGTFECHRLNIGELAILHSRKLQLAGGYAASGDLLNPTGPGVDADAINEMIAHCELAIDKAPPWYSNPLDLFDVGLLNAVYRGCAAFKSFRDYERERETEKQAGSGNVGADQSA